MKLSIPEIRMLERILLTTRGPGIGNWAPGEVMLIVGDRPTKANVSQKPFIHPSGCAPWLALQLEVADIQEEDLYWINAYDQYGKPINASFIDELKPTIVIALGNNAAIWCDDNAIDCLKIPHPQYWRRFKQKETYPILQALSA